MSGFKKTVYPIKYFCVKISLTAFRANFSLNIFNYIQTPMKPMLSFDFLFCCLSSAKFTNHNFILFYDRYIF